MSRLGAVLTAVVLAAGGSAGRWVTSPLTVLRWAMSAPRTANYEGTKVLAVRREGRVESVTLLEIHRRPDAYRMEFLSPERVAGRIFVDTGQESWHYEPSVHLVVRGPSLSRRVPQELDALAERYHVRLLGITRVVTRPAYLVEVVPKGQGIHRRIWVDRATGLILAWQESDPERGVFFASTFTRISIGGDLPPALFRFRPPARARVVDLRPEGSRASRLSVLAAHVGFLPVAPAELPAGFRYLGVGVSRLGGVEAVVLRYGDGVTAVSLFQVPARRLGFPVGGIPLRLEDLEARLYTSGPFRVLVWERAGLRFAAVGNVPTAVLLAFAQGTDPGGETDRILALHRATGAPLDRIEDLRDRGMTFSEIRALLAPGSFPAASAGAPRREFLDLLEGFHEQVRFELTRR
ncbi:MAG: sigma-E factor regulatory protein RseB domain-containing protein [Armatimonadota bacterium]|nr:sigma-E factor regulatory protein RseB domain-containing protein [Armatimonadota bacterium]MDR7443881.1 sigma-E factor regulatory protein RseB domain-containing protein [Armatimonadota bacterium]MDR7571062.1 sigma-E factor regulatory protein RseB domain-containing protein [Armatimonadota bacterium]MDR7615477.1 sigma-E factor regulatory protein RseB domain-containing protein [Armatimonadota bacterium]